MLADRTGIAWDNSMVSGQTILIVSGRQVTLDIKLIDEEHSFNWGIYGGIVREMPEVRSTEDRCPRGGAAMGAYYCPACGFSCPLL